MIEIKNLVKHYGQIVAVNDISFKVKEGEILGFLGPNGAGKSTVMNIITGYLPSTSGTVEVDGYDITNYPEEVKKRIGYLPEQPPLYNDMTVTEYLNFVSDLKKAPKNKKKSELSDIMELVGLTDHRKRLIDNLSKGYRQRVGLAQSLIGNPKVLILDEPTVGLDPKQIVEIRRVIKGLASDRTIILSTHILPEVSMICERVVIINKGQIVAEDTPDRLSNNLSEISKLNITIKGDKDKVLKIIGSIPNVKYITMTTRADDSTFKYVLETKNNLDIREEIFFKMAEYKMPIMELRPTAATLEDIFISVVSDSGIVKTEEE